ncbi:MAG: type II toxin-antitoxin system death-on-curing family toxin [Thermoanaerobaculia bacterium]
MNYLSEGEILELHRRIIEQSGGSAGVRDHAALASSVAQPFQTYAGDELYPTLAHKAAALCFFLISNHPFIDGNKRIGHAAIEVTLMLNGYELAASVDDQERTILQVASGALNREQFTSWVLARIAARA